MLWKEREDKEKDFGKRTEQLKKRLEELELEKKYIASEAQLREKEAELKQLVKEIQPNKLREFVTSLKSMLEEIHKFAEERRRARQAELGRVV